MGEQPVPVENEVERALASMRAGFLSGSDKIAAGVASLEEHLADASFDERDAVRTAVAKIVATQERLKAQMDRLPAPSWERFKAMVNVVKAQQTILDQLGLLVKEHVLPKQLQNLSTTPFPTVAASAYKQAPQSEGPIGADDTEPRSRPWRARERTEPSSRGLAALIVAVLLLSLVPRDIRLQDLAAKLVETVGTGGEPAPSGGPNATAEARLPTAQPPAVTAPRRATRVPPVPDAVPGSPLPGVAAVADPLDAEKTAQPGEKHVAAPAVINEPATPPANAPSEQFVPVVFTHQDHATVMRALADLKQQYPSVLIGRKGEVQPVDLGKKGVWHRLVILPAGSRPEATKLCDQLMAEGYDRCWVKAH